MDYIVKAYKDWKLHSQFHEIVPDMDDDYLFNEKQSIRDSARSLKKYGSTCCNHIRNNETLIRHDIEKTDTLAGIALKYGCTTEQIRRANRLFASDSLFLRQFLLVPVDKTSPYYPQNNLDSNLINIQQHATTNSIIPASDMIIENQAEEQANAMPNDKTLAQQQQQQLQQQNQQQPQQNHLAKSTTTNNISARPSGSLPPRPYSIAGELSMDNNNETNAAHYSHHAPHTNGGTATATSKSLDSVAAMTPEEENRKYINDFLNKIDNTISESRKYVEKSKEMISSQSDNDLYMPIDFVDKRRNNHLNNSYKKQQHHSNSSGNQKQQTHHVRHSSSGSNTSDTAQLLNTTQTRRVQNSLKRLEKQQDEFFEL